MRKSVLIQLGVLVFIFILLSLLDRNSEYVAEIAIWKINNKYVAMSKDPKIYPDNVFNSLIEEYEGFVRKFPKSRLVPEARISMGRIHVLKTDYAAAREIFEGIRGQYLEQADIGVEALLEVARSYALENEFDQVLGVYRRILKEYPLTKIGLMTPLLIAKFYGDNQKTKEAKSTLEQAVGYYQQLLKTNSDPSVRWGLLQSSASCYSALERWEESVGILKQMLWEFSNSDHYDEIELKQVDDIIKTINTISIGRLEDYDLPIQIYRDFIDEHPTHSLKKSLIGVIHGLEELKKNKGEDDEGFDEDISERREPVDRDIREGE